MPCIVPKALYVKSARSLLQFRQSCFICRFYLSIGCTRGPRTPSPAGCAREVSLLGDYSTRAAVAAVF